MLAPLEGALGFHGLRVWPILALGSRDLHLNRASFRVLRCVAGRGFELFFCARVSVFSLKIPILLGFRSHTVVPGNPEKSDPRRSVIEKQLKDGLG